MEKTEGRSPDDLYDLIESHDRSLDSMETALQASLDHFKVIYREIDDLKETVNYLKKMV